MTFLSEMNARWEAEKIRRRNERKAATAERHRKAREEYELARDAKRKAKEDVRLSRVPRREQLRAEKEFAASIGLTWCGCCKAWLPTSDFWKNTRRCKKHFVPKTGMTREQIVAKAAENRAEKQRAKQERHDERENTKALNEIKKHWRKVVLPLFWELTKEERKEQELETRRKWKRKKAMMAAGCKTDEEYQIYLAGKGDRLAAKKIGKPVEEVEAHRKERRRIRDQWRNYRKQVKVGMGANGGRIPAGWMKTQFEAQGGCCALCQLPLAEDEFEIDHIIPVSHGGPNEAWNLQLLHPLCNQEKNDNLFVFATDFVV